MEPEFRDDNTTTQVFEKHNAILHSEDQKQVVTQDFLKKYLIYAKKIAQ